MSTEALQLCAPQRIRRHTREHSQPQVPIATMSSAPPQVYVSLGWNEGKPLFFNHFYQEDALTKPALSAFLHSTES